MEIFTRVAGAIVLDGESVGSRAVTATVWDGDLRHFRMQAWNDDSGIAAAVVARPCGWASGWINLRHVHPAECWPVWLRLRNAAASRGCAVVFADELLALAPPADDRAGA